ncbi:MAG TPA: protein kinase [Thermomicrobiales bacterium]|nr:protein kinase [Thermomicrobiales bacterium]
MSFDQPSRRRPPERLADRYQVQEVIGSGGSAITYRGRDERLDRPVAIKILRSHYAQDETFVRRFGREARTAASVSHGNVVDVYDFGQHEDALYIVMQLIEGEDLKHLIEREAPLDSSRVQPIIGQVLDGLQAIHEAGIIHRDIKPQNVLIGRDGIARVTDFGIAQAEEDSGMTTAGTTLGTAAYMAPEQAQAGRIMEATDLYAVGVVLYEMLTGFLPFNAPTPVAIMLEHIRTPPVPPSRRMPGRGITSSMDAVVLQALAKVPEDRFRSARAMKQAVTRAFQGGAYDGQQPTVAIPAAHGTRQLPHQRGSTRPPQGSTYSRVQARPVGPGTAEREGVGLGGAVVGLLLVILLAVAGGAAWFAYDAWRDTQATETIPPTATVPAVVAPTATLAPEATDAVILPPISTDIPLPTETPQSTPTDAPTVTQEPTATDEPVLIEPIDGTPFTITNDGQSRR